MSSKILSKFPDLGLPLLAYAAGDAFGVFYEFLEENEVEVPQELKNWRAKMDGLLVE